MKYHSTSYCITTTSSERCILLLKWPKALLKWPPFITSYLGLAMWTLRCHLQTEETALPSFLLYSPVPQYSGFRQSLSWGTVRYTIDALFGDEIGAYNSEVQDRASLAGTTYWCTDRYAYFTLRYSEGQSVIGSSAVGSLLYAYAAKLNLHVHNQQYNC